MAKKGSEPFASSVFHNKNLIALCVDNDAMRLTAKGGTLLAMGGVVHIESFSGYTL